MPTGAGEPAEGLTRSILPGVYPRGSGGALPPGRVGRFSSGLSPRVRGSRAGDGALLGRGGSIPAGAGEPIPRRSTS